MFFVILCWKNQCLSWMKPFHLNSITDHSNINAGNILIKAGQQAITCVNAVQNLQCYKSSVSYIGYFCIVKEDHFMRSMAGHNPMLTPYLMHRSYYSLTLWNQSNTNIIWSLTNENWDGMWRTSGAQSSVCPVHFHADISIVRMLSLWVGNPLHSPHKGPVFRQLTAKWTNFKHGRNILYCLPFDSIWRGSLLCPPGDWVRSKACVLVSLYFHIFDWIIQNLVTLSMSYTCTNVQSLMHLCKPGHHWFR